MDISDTDNATAKKASSGFLAPARPAVLTRPITASSASASLDTTEMLTETASSPTSLPTVTTMRGTTPSCRPVSAFPAPFSSEDHAKKFPIVLRTPTLTVYSVFAAQDSSSRTASAPQSTWSFLPAL